MSDNMYMGELYRRRQTKLCDDSLVGKISHDGALQQEPCSLSQCLSVRKRVRTEHRASQVDSTHTDRGSQDLEHIPEVRIDYDAVGQPQMIPLSATTLAKRSAEALAIATGHLRPLTMQSDISIRQPLIEGSDMVTDAFSSNGKGQIALRQLRLMSRIRPRRKTKFSLLKAFIDEPTTLLFELVSCLPIPSLIDLYAISRDFHAAWNRRATAFILASARTWSPQAAKIYPWRHYLSLCIKDPIRRQRASGIAEEDTKKFSDDTDEEYEPSNYDLVDEPTQQQLMKNSRDVPSIRWLQMVSWRHAIAKDMMAMLYEKALYLPPETIDAIKRMWFVLDLPGNALRQACLRSTTYWTDHALLDALHFLIKVDMALTDPGYEVFAPNEPGGEESVPPEWEYGAHTGHDLVQYLVAERSLTPLWRTLHGWSWESSRDRSWDPYDDPPKCAKLDMLKFFVRHRMEFDPTVDLTNDRNRWMGMNGWEIIRVRYELPFDMTTFDPAAHRWIRLKRFDQLLVGEMIRRQIPWKHLIWRWMCFGH